MVTVMKLNTSVSRLIKNSFLLCPSLSFLPLSVLCVQVMETLKSPVCISTTVMGWMTTTSTTETWPYLRFETQH